MGSHADLQLQVKTETDIMRTYALQKYAAYLRNGP